MKTKIPTDEWIKKNTEQLTKADLFMRKLEKEYNKLDSLTLGYIKYLIGLILVQRIEEEKKE